MVHWAIPRRRFAATRATLGVWVLVVGYGIASCSSDSTPTVYVDLAYQVRCLGCNPRAPDDSPREVKAVNGEDGYRLTCEVKKVGGARRVNFAVEHTPSDASAQDHAFRVELANLDGEDTSLQCAVHVLEGVQIYGGACTSDEPSESGGPCQANFRVEKGVIKGGIFCDNIPVEAAPQVTRYIVAPGTSDGPAQVQIYGCHGL